MDLSIAEQDGVAIVEGRAGHAFLANTADANRIVEACLSARVRSVLLYAENLTPAFFDLSSGEAGAILQTLRNYGIRLAVVCTPGGTTFSSRFGEMVAEERRGPHFGVFDTRADARVWLTRAR